MESFKTDNSLVIGVFIFLLSGNNIFGQCFENDFVGERFDVFCNDPILQDRDLVDTNLPEIDTSCFKKSTLRYVTDWVDTYDCGHDTSALIDREYEVYDNQSIRYVTYDTIISLNRSTPVDTVACEGTMRIGDRLINESGIYIDSINGCRCVVPYQVTILEPNELLIIPSENVLCGESDTVVLRANEGFHSYSWSTGLEGNQINLSEPSSVFVSAVDSNGCLSQSDTFHLINFDSFGEQTICAVTFDPKSEKNVIFFEKINTKGIEHYVIFREVLGKFVAFDTINVDSIPQSID